MGWGQYDVFGYNPRTQLYEGRPAGYYVSALCDVPGCLTVIDRGLGYKCGSQFSLIRSGEPEKGHGCGAYICIQHESDHGCPNPFDYEVAVRDGG